MCVHTMYAIHTRSVRLWPPVSRGHALAIFLQKTKEKKGKKKNRKKKKRKKIEKEEEQEQEDTRRL